MDAPLKKILRALSLEIRHTLEGNYLEDGTWNAGDLERRLNQIGIWRDRPVKPISEMPNLSPVDRKARELIDAYLALRSDAGVSQSDAVAEFIRESAYSWANRLFALRCMEARGIIDPVILQEEAYHGRSMVHDRFAQTNPSQCTDEDDGLFAMLSDEFRERSRELPDLFAPESPAVALRPSVVALKHCIALLSGSAPANGGKATDDVFTAPDAFGWAYQFWNEEEKKRVNTRIKTVKGAKIEGCDIASYTTLYTEPYMVKYLVQNSLGATWMMMHPESKLSAIWEYYVTDTERGSNKGKPITEITFLDPACGSGHFLIEAFDLYYKMYEEEYQSKEPADIVRSILNNNLFGIDIDERAVQITKAVLWMKAAEIVFAKTKKQLSGDALSEFHDHIISTNIRLPQGKDHLDAFLKKHPEDAPLRPALLTVFEGLQNVQEFGSLVQIEEPVEKELKALKEQAKQQKFDPESGEIVEKINFSRWKQQVIKRLKIHFQFEAEKALPTEAFFSQSAVKGLELFDLLARRYDVVAANPPYMGSTNMGPWLKSYVEAHYPEGKRDLYASFILRNFQLAEKGGRVAMVTQQSWMFLRSFSQIRINISERKSAEKRNNFSGLLRETNIETIAHLGEGAFNEPAAAGAFVVLFTFLNSPSVPDHHFVAFRLIGPNNPEDKDKSLRSTIISKHKEIQYYPKQSNFKLIPDEPVLYWIPISIFSLFTEYPTLIKYANSISGVITGNNFRHLRFHWEIQNKAWRPCVRGGGYKKWYGQRFEAINWRNDGKLLELSSTSSRTRKSDLPDLLSFCLQYSFIYRGKFGVRISEKDEFPERASNSIVKINCDMYGLAATLNARLFTFLLRMLTQSLMCNDGYVEMLPINEKNIESTKTSGAYCVNLVREKTEMDIIERTCDIQKISQKKLANPNAYLHNLSEDSLLHSCEGFNEQIVIDQFNLDKNATDLILSETGIPCGFFPLICNYDTIPSHSDGSSSVPQEIIQFIDKHKRINLTKDTRNVIRHRLKSLFESGPGIKEELEESVATDDDTSTIGARIPIPAETFIEELSQKMEIHPISIYWLLKEGIEKESWRCIPEEKRYTEDLFTVTVLRLLGHRWPKQIEAGEQVPGWADADGIIPITSGLIHPTLLQQVRDRIAADFPEGKVHEIEKEFEEVVGMSLERWLTGEFFKHHISQFKKRPIAWQLSSSPSGMGTKKGKGRGSRREPAFSCLVYYHKIDSDILHKIRTQYVGDMINRYGTELRSLEGRKELTGDQATRKVQLENWIAELKDFSQALQDVADTGFDSPVLKEIVKKESLDKWTSRDGKSPHPKSVEEFYALEKRYDPDINDGVRVNIMPLQKAGLLAAEVIAKKDVEKAIADRAEWRADERRWCREGKLPKCGWWE